MRVLHTVSTDTFRRISTDKHTRDAKTEGHDAKERGGERPEGEGPKDQQRSNRHRDKEREGEGVEYGPRLA